MFSFIVSYHRKNIFITFLKKKSLAVYSDEFHCEKNNVFLGNFTSAATKSGNSHNSQTVLYANIEIIYDNSTLINFLNSWVYYPLLFHSILIGYVPYLNPANQAPTSWGLNIYAHTDL